MPTAAKTPEEINLRRTQAIVRSTMHKHIETHYCEATGGGVVIVHNVWRKAHVAHYFRPRAINRSFREETLESNHALLAVRTRVAKILAEEKAAKAAPHTLQVGDIIAITWGVTMRDVNFHKVVDIPDPRKVTLAPVPSILKGDWMAGTKTPDLDAPLGEGRDTYKVSMKSGEPVLTGLNSISSGRKWSGHPIHCFSD